MSNIDPCFCISKCVSNKYDSPCPPSKPDEDCTCLAFCNGAVETSALVGPCGNKGFTDISVLKKSTCVCTNELKYQVVANYDTSMFADVYMDGDVLHWTTVGKEANRHSKVTILACCEQEDGTILEYYFTVSIYIADLCAGKKCDGKCEECDPCTGDCVTKEGKISVTSSMGGKISIK